MNLVLIIFKRCKCLMRCSQLTNSNGLKANTAMTLTLLPKDKISIWYKETSSLSKVLGTTNAISNNLLRFKIMLLISSRMCMTRKVTMSTLVIKWNVILIRVNLRRISRLMIKPKIEALILIKHHRYRQLLRCKTKLIIAKCSCKRGH